MPDMNTLNSRIRQPKPADINNAFRRMSCGDWDAKTLEEFQKKVENVSSNKALTPAQTGEEFTPSNLEQIFEVRDREKSFDQIDQLLNPRTKPKPLSVSNIDPDKLRSYGELDFATLGSISNQSSFRYSRHGSKHEQNGYETSSQRSSRTNSIQSSNMGHSGPPALTASILDAVYGDSNATTDSPGSVTFVKQDFCSTK